MIACLRSRRSQSEERLPGRVMAWVKVVRKGNLQRWVEGHCAKGLEGDTIPCQSLFGLFRDREELKDGMKRVE